MNELRPIADRIGPTTQVPSQDRTKVSTDPTDIHRAWRRQDEYGLVAPGSPA